MSLREGAYVRLRMKATALCIVCLVCIVSC